MAEEAPLSTTEELMVALVDCAPPEAPEQTVPLPNEPPNSPVSQGFKAEIERVGAEPPPSNE